MRTALEVDQVVKAAMMVNSSDSRALTLARPCALKLQRLFVELVVRGVDVIVLVRVVLLRNEGARVQRCARAVCA